MEQPRNVLIVDDDWQVREVLHEIFFSAGYTCQLAGDGREGLDAFRATLPPLTVTDLKMPVMDGIALLQAIREADTDAAVIVLTGAADVKTAIESLKLGAHDFIMKPVNVDELLIAAERALERRSLLVERREYQAVLERRVDEATENLEKAYHQLQHTYQQTLEALGAALDSRDVGTESHSRRVHGYSLALAREHGIPEDHLTDLAHGVLLHDIGKIGIPDAILLKQGSLTPEEDLVMRSHPRIGYDILKGSPSKYLSMGAIIALGHHEKYDGTGYPTGLHGEDIPIVARIVSIADVFDALVSKRPYKEPWTIEEGIAFLQSERGNHFDANCVDAFVASSERVREIQGEYADA